MRGIDEIDGELAGWLLEMGSKVSGDYGNEFNAANFDFLGYARENLMIICYRDGRPVGALLARLFPSIFDSSVKMVYQDLLCVSEGSGRAAHILMQHFIDFGKVNANHIFSTIGIKTRIKARSLERLGFKKVEEVFQLEGLRG